MAIFTRLLAGLALCLLAGMAAAGQQCRIAFDMGSSGIRAGQSGRAEAMRANIDYLAPLAAGLMLFAALHFWRFGLHHYQSTGT